MSERLRNTALIAGAGLLALKISTNAFTKNVRKEILERDHYKCVVCGATDCLEASHIDHNRNSPNYNDPNNGKTLCTEDHYYDHIMRHGQNGLTPEQNKWAVQQLQRRVVYKST